jgi:hypothetical protein
MSVIKPVQRGPPVTMSRRGIFFGYGSPACDVTHGRGFFVAHGSNQTQSENSQMSAYCIVETEDGLGVVELVPGMTAEASANQRGGLLVDPGPYDSYEDACEGLAALEGEFDSDVVSDIPATQVLEERCEPKF